MRAVLVLIHSPLVGPLTWSRVADELRRRGVEVVTPTLVDTNEGSAPFWQRHVAAVVQSVEVIPTTVPLALVGHSGAGPLLPAIGRGVNHPVSAYLFVDAGIPTDGKSRLDLMATEDPAFAEDLQHRLIAGERFPTWRQEDLRAVIPDRWLRDRMVTELQPRSRAFFEEQIPVFADWPDAPCSYLQLSAAYDAPAERARREGWPYRTIAAGHFHMLVDPPAVTRTLLDLIEQPAGH